MEGAYSARILDALQAPTAVYAHDGTRVLTLLEGRSTRLLGPHLGKERRGEPFDCKLRRAVSGPISAADVVEAGCQTLTPN
jgi:hypothetical protein